VVTKQECQILRFNASPPKEDLPQAWYGLLCALFFNCKSPSMFMVGWGGQGN